MTRHAKKLLISTRISDLYPWITSFLKPYSSEYPVRWHQQVRSAVLVQTLLLPLP